MWLINLILNPIFTNFIQGPRLPQSYSIMAEGNPSLEEQFLSASLLVGDLNARDNSGHSLILITALLKEDFNASHIPGCSSILASAHDDGTSHKQLLLEYFLAKDDIPRIDKIDALEMAGAVILGNNLNHETFPRGFQYWRRALALRMMDIEGCRPIYKMPTKSKSGQLSEWSTLEELENMEQDPAQRIIQSFVVCLRIASSHCWEAVHNYFLPSFIDFLWMGLLGTPNQCSVSQIFDISWTAVDTILRTERPHERQILLSVYEIEGLILDRFRFSLPFPPAIGLDLNLMNSENLQKLVDVLLMTNLTNPINGIETQVFHSSHKFHLCEMVRLFSVLPGMMTEEIWVSLRELERRDVRSRGFTLLHCICNMFCTPYYLCYLLPSIRLLVQLGTNPNCRRSSPYNACGVLHLLAEEPQSEARDAAARLLLDLGAHLDMADEAGLTAADYWLRKNYQERHRLPDWLKEGVPMLKCLCSRVVRRHRLPHDESNTPAVLIPFVALH